MFNNKYTSHYKVSFGAVLEDNENVEVEQYQKALVDYKREISLLDSLLDSEKMSKMEYQYRSSALTQLMEKHKTNPQIRNWLQNNKGLVGQEEIQKFVGLDLTKADSLMKFHFFRSYLEIISTYNLNYIKEDHGTHGGSYIDARVRFDSIVADKRFNETVKKFLLMSAYRDILMNFKSKDKEKYFRKLQQQNISRTQLEALSEKYNLVFESAHTLQLLTREQQPLTYTEMLGKHKGKWLYIDFWASWCAPCRQTMPAARQLKKDLGNTEVTFIYLALNDQKENWEKAIVKDSIGNAIHYFIVNGNTSAVLEDLDVEAIPHYLIYNPKGELVNGFAKRPGSGAKEQLQKLIVEE